MNILLAKVDTDKIENGIILARRRNSLANLANLQIWTAPLPAASQLSLRAIVCQIEHNSVTMPKEGGSGRFLSGAWKNLALLYPTMKIDLNMVGIQHFVAVLRFSKSIIQTIYTADFLRNRFFSAANFTGFC